MPRPEQTQNGNYIIRSRISGSNSVVTWQVMGGGVTFLNQRGIEAGDQFPKDWLFEFIEKRLVFTGSSGINPQKERPDRAKAQKSMMPTQIPTKPTSQTFITSTQRPFKALIQQNVRTRTNLKRTWPDLESLENIPRQKKQRQNKK
ncbi:MAG TPA: hypothetical protein VKV40_12550 [Ktedonobacteraceae bacterium]|nr:hypothetical protein [Ktedonobacteraceae bacterium]